MRTLIIAEAGVNHNGDMAMARALIDAAAQAGADLVKFQTFSADRLVTGTARKADYQLANTAVDESQQEMLRRLELTPQMHDELILHAKSRGIEFFSTAFDLESLDYLMSLGMGRIKIPSGEITNLPYLRHVGHYSKPVIISTGMATMEEIVQALAILEEAGLRRDFITVLHCNTEYPTPMPDVNLRAMLSIRDTLGVDVGYSDHTMGIEVATAAVALGARIIEKHFTLNSNLYGPDHRCSLEPNELKSMVLAIRNIELAMGDGIKRPSASEIKNKISARRSIVAASAIAAGDVFSESNLTVKRPAGGMSPMQWDEVLGRRAPKDFASDEMIFL